MRYNCQLALSQLHCTSLSFMHFSCCWYCTVYNQSVQKLFRMEILVTQFCVW